jgi:hypothetical protein
MSVGSARYLVTAELLRAAVPLSLDSLVRSGAEPRAAVLGAIWDLMEEGLVAEVEPEAGGEGPRYVWRARWRGEGGRLMPPERHEPIGATRGPEDVGIESETISAFHEFVIGRYSPPADKRYLALFQCSVRRPFSKSPSHASMRRAVRLATGFDPAKEFHECPVHVVVLASRIGPVPYELEDFHPANVRGGGVKHLARDVYAGVRPVLVRRMADYLSVHGPHYESAAAFGDSRYGEVMADAAATAGTPLPIFPVEGGAVVKRIGTSTPRTYWQKAWIQLFLEIVSWFGPKERAAARERLAAAGVAYDQE